MLSAIHFVLLNGLAAAAAGGAARAAFGDEEPWRRALAGMVSFALVIEAATLVVGSTAGLSPPALEIFVGLVAALSWLAARRARRDPGASLPPAPGAGEATGPWRAVAAGLLGAAAGAWIFVSLFDGTRFTIDDLTYHAAVPARWLAENRIHLVPFTYQAYYPHNAELLTLWFLAPSRGDALASLGSLWGAAVLGLAAFGLCRRLGGSSTAALLAAALVSCSGVPLLGLGGFARADLIGAAAGAAGLALAGPRMADLAFVGLALGYAAGCRVSFATVLPCVALWWLVSAAGTGDRGRLLRGLAVLSGGAALAAGYWYAQNAALTGNPFYPAALGCLDGPLDAAAQARTRLATWIAERPFDGAQWSWIALRVTPWPVPFFVLSLSGWGAAALRLGRGRADPASRSLVALVAVVAAVQVAQFPFLPFSGTYNRPTAGLEGIATRYLLLPFALGVACFAGLSERLLGRAWIARAVAAATLATAAAPMAALHGGPALALGAAAGAAAGLGLSRRQGRRRALGICGAGAAAALLACLVLLPLKQRLTDANLFRTGTPSLSVGHGWRALESLPRGSRLAMFMAEPGEYNHFYPLFGRRLQHVPVPVERDGSARPALHLRPRRGWWSEWERLDEPVDPALLARHLAASGVDHVLVTRWTLGRWPPQRRALESIPGVITLFDDGASALYALP